MCLSACGGGGRKKIFIVHTYKLRPCCLRKDFLEGCHTCVRLCLCRFFLLLSFLEQCLLLLYSRCCCCIVEPSWLRWRKPAFTENLESAHIVKLFLFSSFFFFFSSHEQFPSRTSLWLVHSDFLCTIYDKCKWKRKKIKRLFGNKSVLSSK